MSRTLLGEFLFSWRAQLGFTVREASEHIGISPATISRIERNYEIDTDTLCKIFNLLFYPVTRPVPMPGKKIQSRKESAK